MKNLFVSDAKTLLNFARKSIEAYLKDKILLEIPKHDLKFQAKRGVFVTLHENQELRGCIGYIDPIYPIIQAVRDNAITAATEDIRFEPVSLAELDKIKIEISILTPPVLASLEEIRPGIDGVSIESGGNKATYLPQVWENFKTPQNFFVSLCQKANLSAVAYQDKNTKFYTYQAEVFSE